ncbi:hypothetical protein CAP36_06705 [Chitinophagaceae bacterium IBVUCB2]|nr:hypothetical protein CAP36_06705 [Chitinophagaceae bacterium IBVUCB2]
MLKMKSAMSKNIVTFYILLLSGIPSFGQNIDSTIYKYGSEFAQERTYLHYDKSSYAPGETIWFKAYLMEGTYPAFASKNFYVDWTDDKGNLLHHTVSPMQAATTNGQYDIPADYKGSYIHVKAYTKWMLNFDSAFIYEKDIRIISNKPITTPAVKNVPPTITFFPEGGEMVEGVSNKVAFKAVNQFGKPVKVKGVIKNAEGKTMDSLRVLHDGMGFFFLLPKPGEKFIAKWKDEIGVEYSTSLPEVKSEGVTLQVSLSTGRRNFVIYADPSIAEKIGKVNVIGTMNQYQAFKVTKDISKGNAQGAIPVTDLPSGILTITVFDEKWKPLAERITYIDNGEYRFNAEMTVQHWGLNKRARNEIEITVADSLYANFSVAVTDAAIDTDSSNSIISHLLLTSEIKGQVYNPTYYFNSSNDKRDQHLDLVMLTHGWRRFKWEDVVKGKLPVISFERDTAYLSLSGKIYGVTPGQLRDKPHIIIVLSQKTGGEGNKMIFTPVEPNGTFGDPSTIFFDTANVYYQLSKGIKDATVKFMESRLPAYKNRIPAVGSFYNQVGDTTGNARHFQLSDEMTRLLAQFEGKTLENVTLKAKTKTPIQILDEKYTSGLFGGSDGYQFDLVNDKLAGIAQNIFTYLQSKVPGLNITMAGQTPSIQWRGGTPLLYLDEVPAQADFLSSISVSDVAYIKVFRPPFYGGAGGGAGAIAVYTRRGNDIQNTPGKGLANSSVNGYSMIRQFYSPVYSSFTPASQLKDLRTTLYWNPQVVTTAVKNKVKLTFYNSDVAKAFRVIIEGMTKDGQLVRIEQIME